MAKIMLVEDDNNLREIYEARLQAEGYTIVSAHDGEEALVVAKAEKPDLVISDVMMPKISGFEMLDILRNTDGLKDVKVIMLTALGQSDDQQRANKLGADRYLVKSQVTLEDIVKAAHELLGEAEGTTENPEAAATPAPSAAPASVPVTPAPAEPSTPVTAPQPAMAPEPPAAPAQDSVTPSAPSTDGPGSAPPIADTTTPASDDDQVMADAVNKLIADTDNKSDDAKPAEEPPASDKTETPDEQSQVKDDDEDPQNGHVTIANKKVITPIDTKPEKDLDTLLAEEEAKEAASAAGTTFQPSPDTSDEKAAEPTAQEAASVDAKIEDFVAGASSEPDAPVATPAVETTHESAAADTPTPDPQPAAAVPPAPTEQATAPAQPAVKPIVVSEPPTNTAPAAAPTTPAPQADNPASPDPNTIAL